MRTTLNYFLTLLMLFVFTMAKSQTKGYEISGEPLFYEEVINVDSTSSFQLYEKGREWFARTFKNSSAVLQMEDKDAGILIGKPLFEVYVKGKGLMPTSVTNVNYTIKLMFKEGRFKYEITDFANDGYGTIKDGVITKAPMGAKKIAERQYTSIQETCKTNTAGLITHLKSFFLIIIRTRVTTGRLKFSGSYELYRTM